MSSFWPIKTLDEVCATFQYGSSSKSSAEGILPVLRMGNIQDGEIVWDDLKYSSDSKEIEKYQLVENDVLFNRTNSSEHVGKAAIFDGQRPAIHAGYLIRVQTNPELLSPHYLCYYLNCTSTREHGFSVMSKSVNQANINATKLKAYRIPVPTLPEQERIVAILDEAFEGIATATAHAERNLHNARELFQSVLQSTFERKGEDWVETTLDNACTVERGSSPRPIKQYLTTDSDGVNWIKIGDTKIGTKYVTETKQKITREGAKKSRLVKDGDLILTNSMTFGNPFIVRMTGYIHDGWFVLRLGPSLDSEFFYYLLSSPLVREQFDNLAAGAVVKNISSDLVKRAILPIPPLDQQKAIVQKLDALAAETRRLEVVYQRKLDALAELKQSLLQRAFAGEL